MNLRSSDTARESGWPALRTKDETQSEMPLAIEASPVKVARILDEANGGFGLEYDNTCGQKNVMRLDALTYEGAVREARSFLGIQPNDHDEDGDRWAVE